MQASLAIATGNPWSVLPVTHRAMPGNRRPGAGGVRYGPGCNAGSPPRYGKVPLPHTGRLNFEGSTDLVRDVLALAREHLDMEVAFVSEWTEGRQVFRALQGAADSFGLVQDAALPLDGSYCIRVMSGAIANYVKDASVDEAVKDLEATRMARIGAYIGVPLVLSDNRQYGMLCCLRHSPDPSLGDRDVKFMTMIARLIAEDLDRRHARAAERGAQVDRVTRAVAGEGLEVVLQPIVDLASRDPVGFEALSRFHAEPRRGPDLWFAEAHALGLGVELELAAVRRALAELVHLPASTYLSVNVSPETAATDDLLAALATGDAADRVVIEMTEHDQIADYERLNRTLMPYRLRGTRIAVDDAGAGFSSLSHILHVAPEIIKLDVGWTRGIETDLARRSLMAALAGFAAEVGAIVVAEGVETEAEARALLDLGIAYGQGFHFSPPRRREDLLGISPALPTGRR